MKMNCLLFTLLLSMMVVMGRCEFTEQDDERIEGIIIDIMGKMKEQTQQCEFDEFYDSGCQSCEHVCNEPMNKDCHDVCPKYAAYKLAVYISDQRTQQEISKLRNEMEEQHKRNMIIIEIMGASIITIIIILIFAVVIKYRTQLTYTNQNRQMEEGIKVGSLSTLGTNLSDMTDPDLSQETDQILPQPQVTDQILPQPQITDQILRQEADQIIPQEREQILLQGSGSSVVHQENDVIVRQESSGVISEKTVPVQVQNDNVNST